MRFLELSFTVGVVMAVGGAVRSKARRELGELGQLELALQRAESCAGGANAGGWSLPQALAHCAQAIEFSMAGFPRARSRIFQNALGRVAKRRFLRRGVMVHNREVGIPGAPVVPPTLTRDDALALLRRAVAAFEAFEGELAPHFAYGPTTRGEYEELHALHIDDHLSAFAPDRTA